MKKKNSIFTFYLLFREMIWKGLELNKKVFLHDTAFS